MACDTHTCPQICLKVKELLSCYRFTQSFAIQVGFSCRCISWAILVQICYPGTPMETRDPELTFGTKIYEILFIIELMKILVPEKTSPYGA